MDAASELYFSLFSFSDKPFNFTSLILGFFGLVFAIVCAFKLFVTENPDHIRKMENGIDFILLLGFLMLLCIFIQPFYDLTGAFPSEAESGTNDPRVMISGLIGAYLPFMVIGLIFSFNLICWFFLRMVQKRRFINFTLDVDTKG